MDELLKTFDLELIEFQLILVVIPIFFVFWVLMDKMVFQPVLKLVEEREARTSGAESIAADTIREADAADAEFEQKILDARIEAMKVKLAEVNKTKDEASKILGEASSTAKSELEAARKAITEKQEALRKNLANNVDELAKEIAAKVKDGSSQVSAVGK